MQILPLKIDFHVGALYEITQQYPNIRTYCSKIEEQSITGRARSIRLQQAEQLLNKLPVEQKPGALQF